MIGSRLALTVRWTLPLFLILFLSGCAAPSRTPKPRRVVVAPRAFLMQTNGAQSLDAVLETIRKANHVPGVACAVVWSNRLVGLGAAGVRRWGESSAPVTVNDRWHQGSLTKSMTATLAAMLVEEGKIRWDSTLAEVFPELSGAMNPAWRQVTLDELTTNRSGAPTDLQANGLWSALWEFNGTPTAARRLLLERLTAFPPVSSPGTHYEYSNAGFAIAGHMLETVMGRSWEELLTERVFRPLGMTSAGFGAPASPGQVDQPWGHRMTNGNPEPIPPGRGADNPAAIGPAGTVHCSVIDMARYVAFHLEGERRDSALLPKESLQRLHSTLR